MTSNIRQIAIASVLICGSLCLIFVTVVTPHVSRPDSIQRQSPPSANARRQGPAAGMDEIKKHFPKVDYDAPEPTDPSERSKRREKGKHYNNGYISSRPTNHSSSLESEWDFNLSEFPVQQSDAVLIGKTLSGGAFISPDKTGVYTELSLKVEEVLYTDRDSLTNDRTIAISRMGGIVRYRTGDESLFRIVGQNIPTVGKRYLFFLKAIPNSDDFQIVTGYELSPSGAIALDDPMRFREQNGRDKSALIEAVRTAAQQKKSN
jgi:hypothetical protein